jgi:hypothetical protein
MSSIKISSYLNLPGLQYLAGFPTPGNFSFQTITPIDDTP